MSFLIKKDENFSYRSDIDGLRAIAVLSTVIFHLSHVTLPNGYLGVDVFFVISGFLITSIIYNEIHLDKFSFSTFYEKRIRRILPVLLLVLFLTSIFSIVFLLPSDLVGYSKSLISTIGFIANMYFWRDSGYFSTISEQKPLLHMWSLGVEEQFYILFPVFLIIAIKIFKKYLFVILCFLVLASFSINVFLLSIGGDNPAFYLLPSRAWEILTGSCAALITFRYNFKDSFANVCSYFGGILILVSIIIPHNFSSIIPNATGVVLGTALLILSSTDKGNVVQKTLQTKVLTNIGLISFSLYLWHWPIIVFTKYYLVRPLNILEIFISILLMFFLSFLSYKYIEVPFRNRRITYQKIKLFVLLSIFSLLSLSFVLVQMDGFPKRLNLESTKINKAIDSNYRCPVNKYMVLGTSRACELNLDDRELNNVDVVLLGNSHAQMYAPIWANIIEKQNKNGLLVPLNGCLPTIKYNLNNGCIDAAIKNFNEILELENVEIIILGFDWEHPELRDRDSTLYDNKDGLILISAVDDLIKQLNRQGKKVILTGPIATPGWNVASIIGRKVAFGHVIQEDLFKDYKSFQQKYFQVFEYFQSQEKLTTLRPDTILCDPKLCEFIINGKSIYSDSNHLSQDALYLFRDYFENSFLNIVESDDRS